MRLQNYFRQMKTQIHWSLGQANTEQLDNCTKPYIMRITNKKEKHTINEYIPLH